MRQRQVGVEGKRLLCEGAGYRQIVTAQHHPCGKQVSRRGFSWEAVLEGEGFASIVVAASVEIAQAKYIVAVYVGARNGEVSLLQQWNRGRRFTEAKERNTLHLHGLAVVGILSERMLEGGC